MIKAACLMMQKDEGELLNVWIAWHSYLFGTENLLLFDNGSTDPITLTIISKWEARGLYVNRYHKEYDDFTRKGQIFGDYIKLLEKHGLFNFFFPLDCDELLVVRTADGRVSCEAALILEELANLLEENKALGIDCSYYNILGKPEHFFCWPQKKTFFRSGTYLRMDSGFHEGVSRLESGTRDTRMAHIHYHHKPYPLIVEHSKRKLRPFFNVDDPNELKKPENNNRLTQFIVQGEESYMNKFKTDKGTYIPEVKTMLQNLGVGVPFECPKDG